MARRYAEASEQVGGSSGQASQTQCMAYGCPLAGAISDSTKGGGPWFCRFHFGTAADDWQRITTEIRDRKREGLLEADGEPSPVVVAMRERVIRRGVAA